MIDRLINHWSNWSIMIDQWQNDRSFTQKFILTRKKKVSLKFRFNNFPLKKSFFPMFFPKKTFFCEKRFFDRAIDQGRKSWSIMMDPDCSNFKLLIDHLASDRCWSKVIDHLIDITTTKTEPMSVRRKGWTLK